MMNGFKMQNKLKEFSLLQANLGNELYCFSLSLLSDFLDLKQITKEDIEVKINELFDFREKQLDKLEQFLKD